MVVAVADRGMVWMRQVIPLALSAGGQVLVEVDDERSVVRAGNSPAEALTKAAGSVASVFAEIRSTAEDALRELQAMSIPAKSVEIEFGVTLTAEANAVIAKAGANASIKVKVVWERDKDSGP
jgi:hypothetical protein